MADESGSNKPSNNPDNIIPTVEQKPMSNGSQENTNDKRDDSTQTTILTDEVHWIQHATFWSQIGLAIIGICALVIYYCQLQQMISATKATQNAVTNAVQQFRLDERAWLELETFEPTKIEMTDALKAAYPGLKAFAQNVTIRNYGRSVARKIVVRTTMINADEDFGKSQRLKVTEEALRLYKNTSSNKSEWIVIYSAPVDSSLSPGGKTNGILALGGLPDHIENGIKVFPYVVGRIDYEDAFGASHWKKFCFRMSNAERSYCETGNEEDENEEPK